MMMIMMTMCVQVSQLVLQNFPGATPTTTSNPGELAQLQGGAQAPHKLGWKESEKLKQLYKVSIKD